RTSVTVIRYTSCSLSACCTASSFSGRITATIIFIRSGPSNRASGDRGGVRVEAAGARSVARTLYAAAGRRPKQKSFFHVGAQVTPPQAPLEKPFEVGPDLHRVTAAEAEAVPFQGGHVRVDGAEFRRGWLAPGLAEAGPGLGEVLVAGPFEHDAETFLAVGGHVGRARLLGAPLRELFKTRPEVEAHLA